MWRFWCIHWWWYLAFIYLFYILYISVVSITALVLVLPPILFFVSISNIVAMTLICTNCSPEKRLQLRVSLIFDPDWVIIYSAFLLSRSIYCDKNSIFAIVFFTDYRFLNLNCRFSTYASSTTDIPGPIQYYNTYFLSWRKENTYWYHCNFFPPQLFNCHYLQPQLYQLDNLFPKY